MNTMEGKEWKDYAGRKRWKEEDEMRR